MSQETSGARSYRVGTAVVVIGMFGVLVFLWLSERSARLKGTENAGQTIQAILAEVKQDLSKTAEKLSRAEKALANQSREAFKAAERAFLGGAADESADDAPPAAAPPPSAATPPGSGSDK